MVGLSIPVIDLDYGLSLWVRAIWSRDGFGVSLQLRIVLWDSVVGLHYILRMWIKG